MYHAFGDESCDQKIVCYGMILIPEEEREEAENILRAVKLEFDGQLGCALHCRSMFVPAAREKTQWAHLDSKQVITLYETLFIKLQKLKFRNLVATAHLANFPKELPSLQMKHIDPTNPSFVSTNKMQLSEKQFSVWCAQGLMFHLSINPGLDNIRFWLDPDKTKIDWLMNRQQTSLATSAFFADVGPGREPTQPIIMPISDQKPALLEIADSIAYMVRRSKTKPTTALTLSFQKLHKIISPEEIEFVIAPNGAYAFRTLRN